MWSISRLSAGFGECFGPSTTSYDQWRSIPYGEEDTAKSCVPLRLRLRNWEAIRWTNIEFLPLAARNLPKPA